MKVGDIYYQQMEKPDRDYNNAQDAEKEYRAMINMFPDSPLIPRAKQKLRDVQEVLAERETQIGALLREPRKLPGRHCPPADGGRHLSAVLQERPGAAGDWRRLCGRSAHRADRPEPYLARSASACTRCMRTKRRRLCQGDHALSHGAAR